MIRGHLNTTLFCPNNHQAQMLKSVSDGWLNLHFLLTLPKLWLK